MTSGKRLLSRVAPYATVLRGVAHPHRLAILYILSHEPAWPEYIARFVPIKQNLIAHHLKAMVDAGWLTKYTEGRHRMYRVKKNVFKHLWNFLPLP
ncbi:MAG TPA: winged helix-turn-helix domain-containing protein [Patescibacteria group bacterium]|nr:winged helix-turn-helix domain-containing protein [Patescibacteria group bacterium]